jgi:hypothetical protein
MATNGPPHPVVRRTENIAMLYLLHNVPAMASSNPNTNIAQSASSKYSLPFEVERHLASTLAFLAQMKDDPDHIPAVCLQETPEDRGLNILLTVNRSHPGDGKESIKGIKDGFEKIAMILGGVGGKGLYYD